MVLIDKRLMIGGIAMVIVGLALYMIVDSSVPAGQAGMTEEEIIDLMMAEQENDDYKTLAGILFGLGFLLILISFGARRRKGSVKREEKKPAE
ncbi:MAG: hypothetical protein ACW9WZ_03495 [Nitrosopumilus sp.]